MAKAAADQALARGEPPGLLHGLPATGYIQTAPSLRARAPGC